MFERFTPPHARQWESPASVHGYGPDDHPTDTENQGTPPAEEPITEE